MGRAIRIILVTISLWIMFFNIYKTEEVSTNMKNQFEEKYKQWLKEIGYLSDTKTMISLQSFKSIFDMGVPVLPYIIKKIELGSCFLNQAVLKITKTNAWFRKEAEKIAEQKLAKFDNKSITKDQYISIFMSENEKRDIWLKWWKEEMPKTKEYFNEAYKKWQEYEKNNAKLNESDKIKSKEYRNVVDLGVLILPYLMEKLNNKEYIFMNAISELTDKAVSDEELKKVEKKEDKAKLWTEWWSENKSKWILPEEIKK